MMPIKPWASYGHTFEPGAIVWASDVSQWWQVWVSECLTVMATKHLMDFSQILHTGSSELKIGILVNDQNRLNQFKMTKWLLFYKFIE